jgi:hypothetical protein
VVASIKALLDDRQEKGWLVAFLGAGSFATTATCFVGERRWFTCPGCGRRCRIVYGGKLFRCRLCYRLTYASQ